MEGLEISGLPKGVGLTALAVACARALESSRPENDRLFFDPYAKHMTGGTENYWKTKLGGHQIGRMQGVSLRTRFIDDVVMGGVEQGIRQIVILGAGMDCRALRLPFPSDLHVFEIDMEEVLNFKNEILKEAFEKDNNLKPHLPQQNRHCISMDLSKEEPWKEPLLAAGFKVDQPSLWIMEGLLMYLTEQDVQRLFVTLGECAAPSSKIVAQHGGTEPTKATETVQQIFKGIGAKFQSSYAYSDFEKLLESVGIKNCAKVTPYDMGEWAVKRLTEVQADPEEIKKGYYFVVGEKK